MYVVDSSPKMRKFKSLEDMATFVDKFQKKYPDHMAMESGHWIDYVITGVTGEVTFFTDGIKLE